MKRIYQFTGTAEVKLKGTLRVTGNVGDEVVEKEIDELFTDVPIDTGPIVGYEYDEFNITFCVNVDE